MLTTVAPAAHAPARAASSSAAATRTLRTANGVRTCARRQGAPRLEPRAAAPAPLLLHALPVAAAAAPSRSSTRGRVPRPLSAVAAPEAPTTPDSQPEQLSKTWYEAGGIDVVAVREGDGSYSVYVDAAEPRPMLLHWAVNDWQAPPMDIVPPGTHQVDEKAVQTPFADGRHVALRFPASKAPERIVFVLKETQPENWINNGNCYAVQLKPPSVDALVDRVLSSEGDATHWSLKDRFVLACELLDGFQAAGATGMSFVFTWLRLSSSKLLTWARRSNYQSKDIAWMQKVISGRMAEKARSARDPWVRLYARLSLAGLPRGGGNGDDIRMGILHIMRDGGIKEGHRPGRDEPFLEQWHQKLHQNTTPEDVTICEAYLAFLHSGNHDDYWRVLWDNGRITREHLEGMNIPIKAWPQHLPHLIDAFKGYLWTLKTCHGGADMDTAAAMAQGNMDEETRWMLFDMLKNRHEWWVPGKIVEIRRRLAPNWRSEGASRDVLLLDIALDNYFRTCIERTDRSSLARDDMISLVGLVLDNAAIACESDELCWCAQLWGRLASAPDRWSGTWGLQALATAQRVEAALAAYADDMCRHVQPHAEAFGARCSIDPAFITNFSEEVVRGQSVFVLSWLLQALEGQLRHAAGAGAWQVVSQVPAVGEVLVGSLADMQGRAFERPTVVLAQALGGMEDIPPGVVAVLTESATDVLSHVAIRARSQRVLLATCFDDAEWQRLVALQGQHVSLEVGHTGEVSAMQVDPPSHTGGGGGSAARRRLTLAPPAPWRGWAVDEQQFEAGVVGGKANNLAKLRRGLPDWISAPASVALPFGTFEAVLGHHANSGAAETLRRLQHELGSAQVGSGIPPALAAARRLVATQLQAPQELVQELSRVAAAAGLPGADGWAPGSSSWAPVWDAITQVWSSQWAERAWLSRQACGVPEGQLCMSVLLQQVVDGQYAFVLHTANPLTGQRGEMFGELVAGLGEVLVGNFPGRALSFSGAPGGGTTSLLSLPSKALALYAPPGGTLIARSDTNGEDLEAFAGAGLYDSVPVAPLSEARAGDELIWDEGLRSHLMGSVLGVGAAVEAMFGCPQDVEGVVADGRLVVVQARPQVLPDAH